MEDIGRHENEMAMIIKQAFEAKRLFFICPILYKSDFCRSRLKYYSGY